MLRTEALPAGIFANTSGRTSPEGDEKTPTNFQDQFLLSSKQTPPAMILVDSDHLKSHQRQSSDGYSSQITDDEDDSNTKTNSLHTLTDEQLEHLACVYQPLPQTGTTTTTTTTATTSLSESLLQSLSNPLSKLVLRQ